MRPLAVMLLLLTWKSTVAAQAPTDDPLARYGQAWTGKLAWSNVVSIAEVGKTDSSSAMPDTSAHTSGTRSESAKRSHLCAHPRASVRRRGRRAV